MQNSPANISQPMIIFYSDKEPLSKYCPVMLHISPAIRILNENPVDKVFFLFPSPPFGS